jgi:hypothetical protein
LHTTALLPNNHKLTMLLPCCPKQTQTNKPLLLLPLLHVTLRSHSLPGAVDVGCQNFDKALINPLTPPPLLICTAAAAAA